jgi:hypothetical protein
MRSGFPISDFVVQPRMDTDGHGFLGRDAALRGAGVHGRAVLPRGSNIPAEQQLCPTGSMLVGRAALRPGGGRPQGPSQREAFHLIENNSDWWRSNCLPADLATDVWYGRRAAASSRRSAPTLPFQSTGTLGP